jgi:hypothetical protein
MPGFTFRISSSMFVPISVEIDVGNAGAFVELIVTSSV